MDEIFAKKTRKIVLLMILMSLIGVITIPLFPWFGVENEGYNYETDEEVTVTSYTNSGYLHIYADTPGTPDEVEDLDGDIRMIELSFWIALILGIIALAGLTLYRTGRMDGVAHLLLLIAALIIVFSILALVSHFSLMGHLDDLENETDTKISYGYNYIPLIAAIMLLVFAIIYLAIVVPFSGKAVSQMGGGPKYGPPYQQYPPQYPQQPPQYPQQQYQPPPQQYPPQSPPQYP